MLCRIPGAFAPTSPFRIRLASLQHEGSCFESGVMKATLTSFQRRVATLPPVSAIVYNQKVIERREQTALRPDPKGMQCDACR
jgi:hypothetical protein